MVRFEPGSTVMMSPAPWVLANLLDDYRRLGSPLLRISGHADRTGPDRYNLRLSKQRAEAVRDYLGARGIDIQLMRVEAFGENRPLVETPDGVAHPYNRRVEIAFEASSSR